MSMHPVIESPSPYFASAYMRASQDSISNSPIDSLVPKTPNIVRIQQCNDQQVPITPVTQVVHRSPTNSALVPGTPVTQTICRISANSESILGTPVNSIVLTPTSNEPDVHFFNHDGNSACLFSIDQTVPSTPLGNVIKTIRKVPDCGQSIPLLNYTVPQMNSCSSMDILDSYESSVPMPCDAAIHSRQLFQKRLTLNKSGRTYGCSASSQQNLTAVWKSQTPAHSLTHNETLATSITEYFSQPSGENSNALPEKLTSPSDNLDLLSLCGDTPSERTVTSASTSHMLSYVSTSSAATSGVNTRMSYKSEVSHFNTREEMTRMRRPFFSQARGSHYFQNGNQDNPLSDSLQLNLFDDDDDDIFG